MLVFELRLPAFMSRKSCRMFNVFHVPLLTQQHCFSEAIQVK